VIPVRGWEGNRRSDVALALRDTLQCFIHVRAHGIRKADDHRVYTAGAVSHALSLPRVRIGWLGSRVVSVLDSGAEGPGSNRSRDAVG